MSGRPSEGELDEGIRHLVGFDRRKRVPAGNGTIGIADVARTIATMKPSWNWLARRFVQRRLDCCAGLQPSRQVRVAAREGDRHRAGSVATAQSEFTRGSSLVAAGASMVEAGVASSDWGMIYEGKAMVDQGWGHLDTGRSWVYTALRSTAQGS